MDLATVIGYLLAWGALGYGAWHASHGAIGAYIKPGEILLVGGCALGATMASMPLHSVTGALKSFKKMLFSKDAHIDVPMPLGVEEGKLRVRVASGSRASKLQLFAGDKKVQDVNLQSTTEFQEIALDGALKGAPAIRIVVEGPAATVAISELEIR